jgi:hypothetical protein
MPPVYVLALKAFGDFTIALSALQRTRTAPDTPAPVLVAGEHLRALAAALGVEQQVRFIGDRSWRDVPAAFDVGKRGKRAALRSLLELRSEIASLGRDRTLVFDRVGWRETFISLHQRRLGLPVASDNIYAAYAQLFGALGDTGRSSAPRATPTSPRHAVLVPGSRIARKAVPARVSSAVQHALHARGIRTTAIRLEGEDVDIPPGLDTLTLPRDFSVLCDTLRRADLVISADSLSAHLGEYHQLPTFVLTPSPNTYWLPPAAFRDSAWARFDDLAAFAPWLDRQHPPPA